MLSFAKIFHTIYRLSRDETLVAQPFSVTSTRVLAQGSQAWEEGDENLALELVGGVVDQISQDLGLESKESADGTVQFVDNGKAAYEVTPEVTVKPAPKPAPEPVATTPEEKYVNVVSDIDQNIPQASKKNDYVFAVIIANENYQTESKVDFAHNDGNTFKTYCQNVLGIPE